MAVLKWTRVRTTTTGLIALAALVVATGCGKKEDKASDKAPEAVASASGGAAPSAEAQPQDPLMVELKTLAGSCDVNAEMSTLKCKDNEERKLATDFARKVKPIVDSLKTMAAALGDKSDPKLPTVASNILQLAFRTSFGDDVKPGAVQSADAKALIDAVGAVPRRQALQSVPAAVHAAMLSGEQDSLYKMLDARAADKLQVIAYRYLMTHGRLAAFDKVKELTKSDQTEIALAALAAPNAMRNWTSDEQAQICPWARDIANGDRPQIAGEALGLLANCTGDYVDLLLSKGDQLIKSGKFTQAQIAPFRDVCSVARRKPPAQVTDAQCSKNRKLLESVLTMKQPDSRTKIMALSSLEYQWPDEETLKTAEKYSKDADKDLATRADETAKRLQTRIKH